MKNQEFATIPRIVKGDVWYIYFHAWHPDKNKLMPKKVYRGFSKLTTDKQRNAWAKKLRNEFEEKLKSGWTPFGKQDTVIYFDEVEYAESASITGRKKKSIKNSRYYISKYLLERKIELKKKSYQSYTSKLRKFNMWLEAKGYGNYDVSIITNEIILEFFTFLTNEYYLEVEKKKEKVNLDARTIGKYEQNINSFFKWLRKKKMILHSPVYDIPKPKKEKDCAARPIPMNDLKRLLTYMQSHDKQLFLACMFQYYCFVRPGNELRKLKIKDINFYSGQVRINNVDAKNSTAEVVGMPDQLLELCSEVYQLQMFNPEFYVFGNKRTPGEEHYGQNTLRNRFNKIRDELGLPDIYKYYSMKHTGAGILLESGATLVELMDQLRHRELNTTHHYIKRHFGSRSEHIKKRFPNPLD